MWEKVEDEISEKLVRSERTLNICRETFGIYLGGRKEVFKGEAKVSSI